MRLETTTTAPLIIRSPLPNAASSRLARKPALCGQCESIASQLSNNKTNRLTTIGTDLEKAALKVSSSR